MNALLVDDERLARAELRRLLQAHPDVVVVGEARNVREAEARCREARVDVIFLDIEMPGGSGFDLLEALDEAPAVIFTTAYDEYAVRAFEVNALDYLQKPIAPDRLAEALKRIGRGSAGASPARSSDRPIGSANGTASMGATKSDDELASVARVAESGSTTTKTPGSQHRLERVFVREGERCWIVKVDDIRLMESEGNYCRVHFDQERPLILRSLHALEKRLDPAGFFRANRRQIVNLRWVKGLEPDVDGGLILVLGDGVQVKTSRRRSRLLRSGFSL